jgi:membrane dipeptidase
METKENLNSNNCHIDLERMKDLGNCVQVFAAFIDPSYCQAYAMKRAIQIIDKFYQQISLYSNDVMSCCHYGDIIKAANESKVAAILSIEGGDALQGDLSALRMFYKLGVRSICLTWNHRNEIADGVADSMTNGGLTPFGREVIKEMNLLGMLIDLSHISEKGFWDVLEQTEKPILVSHSNSKKLCNHGRNLTDEQIIAVSNNKGVIGINLYPVFLNNSGKASLKDVISHIEYIASLSGIENIGFGADFDGIEITPDDIAGIQHLDRIINELHKLNYPNDFIEKFAGKNFLRVFKEVCG